MPGTNVLEMLNRVQLGIETLTERIRQHNVITRSPHLSYYGPFEDSRSACVAALLSLQKILIIASSSIPYAVGYRPAPGENAHLTYLSAHKFISIILHLYPAIKKDFIVGAQQKFYVLIARQITVSPLGLTELRAVIESIFRHRQLFSVQPGLPIGAQPVTPARCLVVPSTALHQSATLLPKKRPRSESAKLQPQRFQAPAGIVSYSTMVDPVTVEPTFTESQSNSPVDPADVTLTPLQCTLEFNEVLEVDQQEFNHWDFLQQEFEPDNYSVSNRLN